jgi:hypothetical protein
MIAGRNKRFDVNLKSTIGLLDDTLIGVSIRTLILESYFDGLVRTQIDDNLVLYDKR